MEIYNGRSMGKSILLHKWLQNIHQTMKKGEKIAFPVNGGGLAVFEYKGVKKQKSSITLERR